MQPVQIELKDESHATEAVLPSVGDTVRPHPPVKEFRGRWRRCIVAKIYEMRFATTCFRHECMYRLADLKGRPLGSEFHRAEFDVVKRVARQAGVKGHAGEEAKMKQPTMTKKMLQEELERVRVQLASCGAAALGATSKEVVVKRDAWGWSPAYQDVLDLRRKYDRLVGRK